MNETSIAIVGAGASGSLLLIHLLQQKVPSGRIVVFDKNPHYFGRGVAYAPLLPFSPLNVPASGMSAFPHMPSHFLEWLHENKSKDVQGGDFVARSWFGDYLNATIQKMQQQWPEVRVQHLDEQVVDVMKNPDETFYIRTNLGTRSSFSHVALCTGNLPPQQPAGFLMPAGCESKFWINPWRKTIEEALNFSNILILGTGLSMVDWVISLKKKGFGGSVTALSRNGFLPLVHHSPMSAQTYTGISDRPDIREIFEHLRNALRKNPDLPWQNVLDGLRPLLPSVWRNTSTAEKRMFLSRLRKFWEIHRHRIPQESSVEIMSMIHSGQLRVKGGAYTTSTGPAGLLTLQFPAETKSISDSIEYDLIINCTGPDPAPEHDLLLNSLINQGLASPDPLGIGIRCNAQGQVLNTDSLITKGLFAIGPVRRAESWETTAVREIREQAAALAEMMVYRN